MSALMVALTVLVASGWTFAQNAGGQFCVRAFEDRNGNGTHDTGEPYLTQGVSAQLLNSGGVVAATALLDNSPTAAQGIICFTGLTAGQYSMVITSADFKATTPSTMTVSVSDGAVPPVMDFGGQRITDIAGSTTGGAPAARSNPLQDKTFMERILFAALGAFAVVIVMALLGVLIYFFAFRSRLKHAVPDRYMNPRTTTGSNPAVRVHDSGEFPRF
jgi:hypothetical protein